MKNLLLVILMLSTWFTSVSQVSSWRTNPPSSSTPSSSSQSTKTSTSNSSWRNSQPNDFNKPKSNPTVIIREPWFGYGRNRWDIWGGP